MESFKKYSFQITNLNEGDLNEKSSSLQKTGTKKATVRSILNRQIYTNAIKPSRYAT